MAIEKQIQLVDNFGVEVLLFCYCKVERVSLVKTSGVAVVSMKAGATGKVYQQRQIQFSVDLESEVNPIAQAYAHLKTLPEFAGAVDC
jgi:pyridoxine 5'-phosphate synthase PdxJ